VKNEFIYVICGKIMLVVEDRNTSDRASMELVSGDLVNIPVTIAHAFRTIEIGHGLEFSAEAFDVRDIFPHSLISG
jgi:cupin superfamily acireductone dioxygenase involved in methionine salvage